MNILRKLFAFGLALFYAFGGVKIDPSVQEPMLPENGSKLSVVCWADPQISNYIFKRVPYFDAACKDVGNSIGTFDALLIAGDITENANLVEYDHVKTQIPVGKFRNYIMAVGNHDVRIRSYRQVTDRFTGFTNDLNGDEHVKSSLRIDALHYKYVIKGYTFIVLGTDSTEFEESDLSPAQLKWLDDSLAEAAVDGKPVFVTVHQPLKDTHGLPGTWNSPVDSAGSVGESSDQLREILCKYKNVILLTGHLHTGFGRYTYEQIGSVHSVNLPSLTIDNQDGRVNGGGLGFWMEVFEDHVTFHARDFSHGENLPKEDIIIRLEK